MADPSSCSRCISTELSRESDEFLTRSLRACCSIALSLLVDVAAANPTDGAGDAFRSHTQVSFGPTSNELARVQVLGIPAYLEDQFNNRRPVIPMRAIHLPKPSDERRTRARRDWRYSADG